MIIAPDKLLNVAPSRCENRRSTKGGRKMFGSSWKSLPAAALLVAFYGQPVMSSVVIRPVDRLKGIYDTGESPYVHDIPFDVDMATSFSTISNVDLRLVGTQQLGIATARSRLF
jgi:hypothetical protein